MRYLEIKWVTADTFVIINQSHRGDSFGQDGSIFVASNGVQLHSSLFPCLYRNLRNGNEIRELTVACRGSYDHKDYDEIKVGTYDERKKITEAIYEYNSGLVVCTDLDDNLFKI